MRTRGVVLATAVLACVVGCNKFGGFPRAIQLQAFLGEIRHFPADGDVIEPRFGAGPGLFLAYTGIDAFGLPMVARTTATTFQSADVSVPAQRSDTDGTDLTDPSLDGPSGGGAVSANGSTAAFLSLATNVLDTDTSGTFFQAFVRDLDTGTNELVSRGAGGAEANAPVLSVSLSGDGRFVAFATAATNLHPNATNGLSQVYVYDRTASLLQLISHDEDGFAGNGGSWAPMLSRAGTSVAFHTEADNIIAGDTNLTSDILVYDRSAGLFDRASVDTGGGETLFENRWASISHDARFVAFSGTMGGSRQIFLRDRTLATTELVSMNPATLAAGNDDSDAPSIDSEGTYIAFHTDATNLDPADTGGFSDVYVYDRLAGALGRASVNADGDGGIGDTMTPSISPDGVAVAFVSLANNLVEDDDSFASNLFIAPNPLLK